MLSDEQLLDSYHSDSHLDCLRAVESAVRADQIEKDAAVARSIRGSHYPGTMGWESADRVAAAIRAQLEGTTDE